MLAIENQDKNSFFTINNNCIVTLNINKITCIHSILLRYPYCGSAYEELGIYTSYEKAQEVYLALKQYITESNSTTSTYFKMPEDN